MIGGGSKTGTGMVGGGTTGSIGIAGGIIRFPGEVRY